ncbi:hypothetical protein ES703_104452 [subsurface metagenome]
MLIGGGLIKAHVSIRASSGTRLCIRPPSHPPHVLLSLVSCLRSVCHSHLVGVSLLVPTQPSLLFGAAAAFKKSASRCCLLRGIAVGLATFWWGEPATCYNLRLPSLFRAALAIRLLVAPSPPSPLTRKPRLFPHKKPSTPRIFVQSPFPEVMHKILIRFPFRPRPPVVSSSYSRFPLASNSP